MVLKKKKKRLSKKRLAPKRRLKLRPKKRVARKVRPKKKPALKKGKKAASAAESKKKVIGKVTHYFPKVRAGVIKLKAPLSVGEAIKIKGHTTDFTQTITSMQIDHLPIDKAKKGDEIGLLVNSRVRKHDIVYKA
jgi:putative protease